MLAALPILERIRRCTKCIQDKPDSAYGKAPRNPEKKSTVCKECTVKRQREWGAKNKLKNLSGIALTEFKCRTCDVLKPIEEFYRVANTKNGIGSECVGCVRHRDRLRYRKDPSRRKTEARWGAIKSKFSLTQEQWFQLLSSQGGKCAICDIDLIIMVHRRKNSACTDHDHETGAVRGILCTRCNQGIGLLQDQYDVVQRAADYLKRHGK